MADVTIIGLDETRDKGK